jgi:hypothetical protein
VKPLLEEALPHLMVMAGIFVVWLTNDLGTAAFVLALVVYVRQK